ncbi:type II secretion system F family protein [Flocculibacter collagenilyticus]|uniref:type II secretion system F family protein n=1 Tax=Flocculibacter collagenilyticus TaxID=2744479 RepID=UPI0018F6E7B6|nr:type II secretion system F family protein [Flocculibacter collagenilyticus]
MATFDYRARNSQGELKTGTIEAASEDAAAEMILGRQLSPIKIEPAKSTDDSRLSINSLLGGLLTPNVGLDHLIIFTRQMYSLVKAGIPIIRAISGLAETSNNQRLKAALNDVVEQLERGRTLSSAMNRHPRVFTRLMVSLVHVGENTGKLDDSFLQLSEYFEREQETRKRIKTAMRYPTLVIIFLIAAMFILNTLVIPQFADMFSKLGADLPWSTRLLITTSDFFVNYGHILFVAIVLSFIGFRQYISSEVGQPKWDKYKLNFPIIGSVIERSLLGRYCRSFSMILRAGVPLTTGLSLVAEAVDNKYMEAKIIEMRRNIERGDSMLRASNNSQLFSRMVLQMIAVGEETGRVDELLEEAAEFYEREVDFDLKTLTARIEPILIIIVAIMVLILALGIFTPMWDMMNAYKGG